MVFYRAFRFKSAHSKFFGLLLTFLFLGTIGAINLFDVSFAYADYVDESGIFTDSNDVRWEYERAVDVENDIEAVTIRFFDKPADASTIVVPSLSEVLENVPNASQTLDTYFLDNANTDFQDNNFTETRRVSNTDVTKLDMSNTSKIQITGISPILNPSVEAELVFGDNMVISDVWSIDASISLCTGMEEWLIGIALPGSGITPINTYRCTGFEYREFKNLQNQIPHWNLLSNSEKEHFWLDIDGLAHYANETFNALFYKTVSRVSGYAYEDYSMPDLTLANYYRPDSLYLSSVEHRQSGVFSGYKLKLTDFSSDKFNYLGWRAFSNSTLNDTNKIMTVEGDFNAGDYVFENTNIEKVILKSNNTGRGMFKDCANLTDVEFDDSVTTVSVETFLNTNLGGLDLSTTNIKTIKPSAFENAKLSSLNLGDVERIEWRAFKNNPGLTELYLPKSINWLGVELFGDDINIKKVTVAYDTLTSGTGATFHAVFDNRSSNGTVEELVLLAPYGPDDEVSPTHVPYETYRWHINNFNEYVENMPSKDAGNCYGNNSWTGYATCVEYMFETDYAKVDEKKNVVAPVYFSGMFNLKKITIGEGYEYIGSLAFWLNPSKTGYVYDARSLDEWTEYFNTGVMGSENILESVSLPSTLKGIGNFGFAEMGGIDTGMQLPEGLEFIGIDAFRGTFALDEFDFNLPNLEYLGDEAFKATKVKNIYIGDKLKYFGLKVFESCPLINNVTIDYDMFNPVKNALYDRNRPTFNGNGYAVYGQYDKFNVHFGLSDGDWVARDSIDGLSDKIKMGYRAFDQKYAQKFGTITFTEKVQTEYPSEMYSYTSSGGRGNYFAYMLADKIDLSKTGWKIIPPYFFVNGEYGELLLPKNLETIMMHAFNSTKTGQELVLPDTLQSVDVFAFHQSALKERGIETLKISSLPESIKTVLAFAFYDDDNLTADVILPDAENINVFSFMRTSVRNVRIGNGTGNFNGTFAFYDVPTLENLEIRQSVSSPFGMYFRTSYEGSGYNVTSKIDSDVNIKLVSDNGGRTNFYDARVGKIDLSEYKTSSISNTFNKTVAKEIVLPNGIETIDDHAFYMATVDEPITIPETVKNVADGAFQWSDIALFNTFSEGLETIGGAAFYGADVHGDLTIPSTVTSIGWSAFNAGDRDTHYDTVTIKPALNYDSTDSQAVFQLFWNATMDKLVIESPMLPVLATTGDNPVLPHEVQYIVATNNGTETITVNPTLREDGEPEFHGMTMREAVITSLPEITVNAFEECAKLEKVTFSNDAVLNRIDKYAFNNATKLKRVVFGEANNDRDINIEEYAFNNTAIESLGTTDDADFNLAAAKFNTVQEHAFSNMPKLKTVDIPNNFNIDESMVNTEKNVNGSYITSFTFSDDPELEQVTIGYQVSEIRDGAFLNDEKLTKLFVWGNAEIQESDDLIRDFNNTTIPKGTTIFAYSDAPAEAYANAESREECTGEFYALDEVLAITANKSLVVLNDDKTDFDKTGLKLYALRRDGVILESDWKDYNTALKRTEIPGGANISFEEGRGRLGSDGADIASVVYDAPKPFNTISLVNRNFENVDYDFLSMPSSDDPLVLVHYPDGYTGNIRNTTLVTKTAAEIIEELLPEPTPEPTPEDELSVPNTGVYDVLIGAATSGISIVTVIILGGVFIVKKCK